MDLHAPRLRRRSIRQNKSNISGNATPSCAVSCDDTTLLMPQRLILACNYFARLKNSLAGSPFVCHPRGNCRPGGSIHHPLYYIASANWQRELKTTDIKQAAIAPTFTQRQLHLHCRVQSETFFLQEIGVSISHKRRYYRKSATEIQHVLRISS